MPIKLGNRKIKFEGTKNLSVQEVLGALDVMDEDLAELIQSTVFTYDGLKNALSKAGDKPSTIIIGAPITIQESLTIPENICLKFLKRGKLIVNSEITLTINGTIKAGLWQIFDGDGTITGNPKIEAAYPEWFGAKGDAITDDTSAILKTLSFFNKIMFTQNYAVTQTISLPSKQLTLQGHTLWQSGLIAYHSDDILVINNTVFIDKMKLSRKDEFYNDSVTKQSACFKMPQPWAYSKITNCIAYNSGYVGFDIFGIFTTLENCISDGNYFGYIIKGAVNNIIHCSCERNYYAGIYVQGNANYFKSCYLDTNVQSFDYGNGEKDTDNKTALYGALHITGSFNTFVNIHFNSNNGAPKFSMVGSSAYGNKIVSYEIYYDVDSSQHGPTVKIDDAGSNSFIENALVYFKTTNSSPQESLSNLIYVDGTLGNNNKVIPPAYDSAFLQDCKKSTWYISSLNSQTIAVGLITGGGNLLTNVDPQYFTELIDKFKIEILGVSITIDGQGTSQSLAGLSLSIKNKENTSEETLFSLTDGDSQFGYAQTFWFHPNNTKILLPKYRYSLILNNGTSNTLTNIVITLFYRFKN